MTAATPEDLPPVAVLIVEDHAYAAEQLSQLLLFWGVANVHVALRLDEVIAYFEQHPEPALVLLDHTFQHNTSVEIALWLAARPALRRQLRVAAYTNADEGELLERLRTTIGELEHDDALAERLLGRVGTSDRDDAEVIVRAARVSLPAFEHLYRRLYDAYLSKRLAINEVRRTLRKLALAIVPSD